MPHGALAASLRYLRARLAGREVAQASDGHLLEKFATQRDEAAFGELLRRHGSMVLAVCRRTLRHEEDAEDVFQATFLVLARKAAALRRGQALESWLYRVALRAALKYRQQAGRRQRREKEMLPMAKSSADVPWDDLPSLVDAEIQRLPEKYRRPLILCYLEGKTNNEAASCLEWPEGTVKGRLARAREILRARLSRQGVALTATALVAALQEQGISAAVPDRLVRTVVSAAVPFAAGAAAPGVSPHAVALASELALRWSSRLVTKVLLLLGLIAAAGACWVASGTRVADRSLTANFVPDADASATPEAQEDGLPAGALFRLGSDRFLHAGASAVVFGNDPRTFVSVGRGGVAYLWDAATGKRRLRLPMPPDPEEWLLSAAISPDGKTLAAGGMSGTVLRWALPEGTPLPPLALEQADAVDHISVRFSCDSKTLIVGRTQEIDIWSAVTGKRLRRLTGPTGGVGFVDLSPNGRFVAAGVSDGQVRLYDLTRDSEQPADILATNFCVMAVQFLDNGRLLTASQDGTVRVWDVLASKEQRQFRVHEQYVSGLHFSRDGKTLGFTHGKERCIHLWDVEKEKEVRRLETRAPGLSSFAFSPDARTIAAWSNNGGKTDNFGGPFIHLWNVVTGQEQTHPEGHDGHGISLGLTPDGKTLVSAADGDEDFRVWDVMTAQQQRRFRGCADRAFSFGVAEDTVIAASHQGTLRRWRLSTGAELPALQGPSQKYYIGLSCDGRYLVTQAENLTVHLWDTGACRQVGETSMSQGIHRIAVAPGGKHVAARPSQPAPVVFESATGKQLSLQMPHGASGGCYCSAFSPNGRFVALAGFFMQRPGQEEEAQHVAAAVFDLATGREHVRFGIPESCPLSSINCLAFSPDGRTLAAGAEDGTVVMWELASGKERVRFTGHEAKVTALVFTPDGRRLLSASEDCSILIWKAMALVDGGRTKVDQMDALKAKSLWDDLASMDGNKAYQALGSLIAAPEHAIPLLQTHLQPMLPPEPEKVRQWIVDLDSKDFAIRQKANVELEKAAEFVESALRQRLSDKPPLETRRRVEKILDTLAQDARSSPSLLRSLRAVEVLEYIGTTEARQKVSTLAQGHESAWLTREAKVALQRLAAPAP